MKHRAAIALLERCIGDSIPAPSGEVRFNSPFRERFSNSSRADTRGHLYVNFDKGVFTDYKAGFSGSLSYLCHLIGCSALPLDDFVPSVPDLRDHLKSLEVQPDSVLDAEPTNLPDYYQPVVYGSAVYRYLRFQRGVPDEEMVELRLGEGAAWAGKDRSVILPSLRDDETCDFWVERTIDPTTGLRYVFEVDAKRRKHVGFLDRALRAQREDGVDYIVVTEGVFSAFACGRLGVCVYGNVVSLPQIDLMARRGVRRAVLALDGGVPAHMKNKTAARMTAAGIKTHILDLPGRSDPDDMGRVVMEDLIFEALSRAPYSTMYELRSRIEGLR